MSAIQVLDFLQCVLCIYTYKNPNNPHFGLLTHKMVPVTPAKKEVNWVLGVYIPSKGCERNPKAW